MKILVGDTEVTPVVENVQWLGHDSFRFDGERVIYVDPYKLRQYDPADLILITHDHFDHFSLEDVAQLRGPKTTIVTVPTVARQLTGSVITVKSGDTVTVDGALIEAVPAYNINKFRTPGAVFHPRDAGGVGFVVTVAGRRVYHAGDTDSIPEMVGIRADVALLPVSGTYVMTAEEAAQAAMAIRPGVAIPMHYASIVGSRSDAERFATLCRAEGIQVELLEPA